MPALPVQELQRMDVHMIMNCMSLLSRAWAGPWSTDPLVQKKIYPLAQDTSSPLLGQRHSTVKPFYEQCRSLVVKLWGEEAPD